MQISFEHPTLLDYFILVYLFIGGWWREDFAWWRVRWWRDRSLVASSLIFSVIRISYIISNLVVSCSVLYLEALAMTSK